MRFDSRLKRLEGDDAARDSSEAERLQERVAARWRAMIDSVPNRAPMIEFDRHRENATGSRAGTMYDRVWRAAFERECGFSMQRDAEGVPRRVAVDVDALVPGDEFMSALVTEASAWVAATGHERDPVKCAVCDEAMSRRRGAYA